MKRIDFFLQNLKGKILDVGFSSGTMHNQILKKFDDKNVFGIDVDFHKEHNGNYVLGSAEEMPFASNVFDSILAGELIEHLYNPEKFVSEAYRTLKKDGVLVLSTPNKKSLINRVFKSYEAPLHFHLFDFFELKNFLQKEGFVIKTFFCLPFTEESCDGSRVPWLFFLRKWLHFVLPTFLQEDMVVVAKK